jgi:hypothetical protein
VEDTSLDVLEKLAKITSNSGRITLYPENKIAISVLARPLSN